MQNSDSQDSGSTNLIIPQLRYAKIIKNLSILGNVISWLLCFVIVGVNPEEYSLLFLSFIISIIFSLNFLFYQLGDYDRALEYYQKEETVREELGEKTILSHIFHNMALIYYDKKNFSKAREYHEKGLNINIELGSEKKIARSLIELAFFYGQLKNFDKAINYLRTSLKIVKRIKAITLPDNGA